MSPSAPIIPSRDSVPTWESTAPRCPLCGFLLRVHWRGRPCLGLAVLSARAVVLLALLLLAGCATLHVTPGAGSLPLPDPACLRLSAAERQECKFQADGRVVCGDRCYDGAEGNGAYLCDQVTIKECLAAMAIERSEK